ncbi:HAMP domain-containing protein [Methanoculleus sp.]|jgi:methyl-accepting chemotaxis protein|uniref:HAMP domain-containing protein n=1 Tax=Methanoculleus sp. TaxID=90427 RepID=UPI001BD2E74F|nr:HAMP domain-containing protein [Methanoculleus sp.]
MTEIFPQEVGILQDGLAIQIPIFYKLMASMLTVAVIPIFLLGIVSAGDTGSVIAVLGLQNSIIVMTLLTLSVILMWSFCLAKSITTPIEQLSKVATSVSQGDLADTEITVTSNDEIGELAVAFNRLINSYRILDTLAKDDAE